MDRNALQLAMNGIVENMGDALIHMSLIEKNSGQAITGVNSDSKTDVYILQALNTLIRGSSVGRFTIIDTADSILSTVHFEGYILLIRFNKEKMLLGMYMGVVLPNAIESLDKVLA